MRTIRNILWLLCGGLISFAVWFLCALLCFATVIGIPAGFQCLKLASLSVNPFSLTVSFHGSLITFMADQVWRTVMIVPSAVNLLAGIILSFTIIGIPFAREHFKIIYLARMPFSSKI